MPSKYRRTHFPRYERLINLYPSAYRHKYAQVMTQTLADMLDDANTTVERRVIWLRVGLDFPLSLANSHFQAAKSAWRTETPAYVKESGALALILVLPFFAALSANGLDKVINNHTLYNSWLWRMPVLGLWVLWLPALGLSLAIISYLRYIFQKKGRQQPWLKRVFDIQHGWPLILPAVTAFGILFILAFHDSAHCWVQNPLDFISRFHQTWQCTRNGFLGG